MNAATEKIEASAFQQAVTDYRSAPNSAGPIEVMMRLATGARRKSLRQWSATWLLENCNIKVTQVEEEGQDATPTEASSIR